MTFIILMNKKCNNLHKNLKHIIKYKLKALNKNTTTTKMNHMQIQIN